jgi:hypothetical protein
MADEGIHEEDTERLSLEERRAMERAPLDEAGEGESEGFELAEEALIENASHGDQHNTTPILRDASDVDEEIEEIDAEADDEEPRDL